MAISEARPPVVSWANRITWGLIVVFAVLFAVLTAHRIRARDHHEENDEKVAELHAAAPNLIAVAPSLDWPQWRGPNRDGVSRETGLLPSWPENGLNELWSRPTGDGYSSVVIARGRAITMVQDGADEAVVCWDAATGKELWRFKYAAHFRHRQFGDGPRSTPAIAGDHVYTVGGTGVMHCLKLLAATAVGEAVWRKDLLAPSDRQLEWGVSFSPLVDAARVYVMPGGRDGSALEARDAASGSIIWQGFDDIASYSSPVAADLAGRRQIVFLTAERLIGVAPEDGKLLWEFPWLSGPAHTPSSIGTPLVIHRDVGDYVFIASGYEKGCALIKIDRDGDGFRASQVYRNLHLRSVFSSPVCSGDAIFGFDDATLACVDLRNGQRHWRQRAFGKGSLMLADGNLIVHGDDGTVALVAADPHAYREQGRFQHSDQRSTWTMPTLADGRLYVRDWSRLTCYDLKKSP
jgi:outer membrane protein assembly factor BamB